MHHKISLGVSACLLGENVRYDGLKRLDPYIAFSLGEIFNLVPVCPETECGLPVPRAPMRIESDSAGTRLMVLSTGKDLTGLMQDFCSRKIQELRQVGISGFILKARSPSCEPFSLKIIQKGQAASKVSGMFAAAIQSSFPLLPVEHEERLGNPAIRENFLQRVVAYDEWHQFLLQNPRNADLIKFHTFRKLLMMSHSISIYREMGRLVANCSSMESSELFARYGDLLMKGVSMQSTVSKNVNSLQHVAGYFRKRCTDQERELLLSGIERYRRGGVSLPSIKYLFMHYAKKHEISYLLEQVYLERLPFE